MKKTWESPRLIILTRGQPQEAVLTGCKNADVASGPDVDVTYCSMLYDSCFPCEGFQGS